MTDARKLRLFDVDRLADECADQTARFFSQVSHDTGYCYELFRRAIVGRNSYAWEKVYLIYHPLVASWVRRHSGLPAAGPGNSTLRGQANNRHLFAVKIKNDGVCREQRR